MTRRQYLAVAAAAVTAGCGRRRGTGFPGYALVATAGENSISIVDLTAFRVISQVKLNAAPAAILAGGPQNESYVLTPESGTVHLLRDGLNLVGSRRLAKTLAGFRLTHDRRYLVAIAPNSRELIVAESANLEVVRRFALAGKPSTIETAFTERAAVCSGDTGLIEIVDLNTGRKAQRQLNGAAGEMRFRGDGKLLLIAGMKDRLLTALDAATLETVVELPLAMAPENLCFNADGGQLFVSGEGMDAVAIVFPYDTIEVEQTVLAGRDPGVMACSDSPAYLFVASASGSDVCILNVNTRKVAGIVDVGQGPSYIAVTPDNQYALVLNRNSGDMAVIHIPAIRSNHAKSGSSGYYLPRLPASLFTLIPVGSRPVQAALVSRAG